IFAAFSRDSLNTADTGSNGAFTYDTERADTSGGRDMCSSAKFNGRPKTDRANIVAVFLAEKGHGTLCSRLIDGYVAVFLNGEIAADFFGDVLFHGTNFF